MASLTVSGFFLVWVVLVLRRVLFFGPHQPFIAYLPSDHHGSCPLSPFYYWRIHACLLGSLRRPVRKLELGLARRLRPTSISGPPPPMRTASFTLPSHSAPIMFRFRAICWQYDTARPSDPLSARVTFFLNAEPLTLVLCVSTLIHITSSPQNILH